MSNDEKLGYGNCSDCVWYKQAEGCNVKRDSHVCNLNRKLKENKDE
jgi:hypothetical protein